ncbi:MAG: xanthine dehydrogenase family protein molybdopterin-binding subunit [Acidobacteriota bacterium]|nr:xanthine dehydrogenase family protein molybdopterin-binding subunit [Acidobacteriota bacterium]
MSIISKVTEAVVQFIPDRDRDTLSEAERLIGKPIDRLDGREKVTGAAQFSAEFPLEKLAYAALAYSTIAKGTIKSIDVSEAEKAPGVIAVITHRNAPKMKDPPLFSPAGGSDAAGSKANVINTDEIFWNGQPVAVIVADTLDRAEHAASLVKVEYRQETAATSFAEGKAHLEVPKSIMGEDTEVNRGDAEAALAKAKFKVDHIYTTPRYNHNAIELHATTAVWNGNKLTVYEPSQFVRGVADSLAKMFSLNKEDVRVLAPFVGGGFGGKGSMWSHVQLCVLAAKVVDRPVKLVLSREGVFRIVGGRTPSEQRVALGADETGKLISLIHTGITATSFTNDFAEQFSFPARHLYATENLFVTQSVVRLNTTANTFMRAPGESIGTFALESAMDELAYELGIDPVELRIRNDPERDPAKETEFSSRHFKEAYQLGAEKFGWANRTPQVRSMRDGKWLIGQGVGTAFYPAYRFPAAARVRLNADGTAVVQSSAQEMGMGTATVQTQHAAERLGLPMEKVHFEYGDTNLPQAPVAGGSNQTISLALAVQLACEKLQRDLLTLAKKDENSPLAGSHFDDIRACDSGLFRRDKRETGESYVAILARLKKDFLDAEAMSGQAFESMKYSMGSYGAQFCEIRVNEQTGEARVSRWVGAFDTGRILNPKTARSQFMGGIIMGIGMALTEETFFDERSGRIANPSLAEYHVPVNADIPNIEAYFLDIPDPHTPLGAHGIGEIGVTGAAAAVANAVFHATGKRVRHLPITLDKLL